MSEIKINGNRVSQISGTVQAGTIIRPFGGERFNVVWTQETTYGEIRFYDWNENELRMSDGLYVEILGHFNI